MPPMTLDDPTRMKAFKYVSPTADRPKQMATIANTDRLLAAIQVIKSGGENNLHSHLHLDGFWFVLSGRARFYSDLNTLAAELGPHEGVLIPRGVKYWFESAGDAPLEILQVECSDVAIRTRDDLRADRVDHAPRSPSPAEAAGAIVVKTN